MKIQTIKPKHHPGIIKLIKGLSAWFNSDAQISIPIDIKYTAGFVAMDDCSIVGFITYVIWDGAITITWMGVALEWQYMGIGTKLLNRLEKQAGKMGINEIRTYTLGDSVDYAPYEQTRKWYFKNGFVIFQRSKTDNPGCPEEIKIKKLLIAANKAVQRSP